MPAIFNVDHKVMAMTALAATASVAVYSLYRLHALKQKLASRKHVYETAISLNRYLIFHYGSADEILPFSFGPKPDADFPKRCAELCIKHTDLKVLTTFAVTEIISTAWLSSVRMHGQMHGCGGAHARAAGCSVRDSYIIQNFGHFWSFCQQSCGSTSLISCR